IGSHTLCRFPVSQTFPASAGFFLVERLARAPARGRLMARGQSDRRGVRCYKKCCGVGMDWHTAAGIVVLLVALVLLVILPLAQIAALIHTSCARALIDPWLAKNAITFSAYAG